MSQHQTKMVDAELHAPKTTPEEPKSYVSFNQGEGIVPFMDGDDNAVGQRQRQPQLRTNGKPHLRFYAVGPSTCQISCPLCKNRADTETVQMSGILGSLSCLLSTFSCCFPIFSLSFVYLCLQSRYKSKRLFCNKCGGYLGYYWRPT